MFENKNYVTIYSLLGSLRIIYRDIIVRHRISNHTALKELVYYLASNVGKEITNSSLKKSLKLSSTTTVSNYGRFLENIVFIELSRKSYEIFYHRQAKECDFLVREKGRIVPAIQVCSDMTHEKTSQRELEGLVEALSIHKLTIGTIITTDEREELTIINNGKKFHIFIVPIWQRLLEGKD